MHELSLAMNMREIIEEQAAQEPFSRVTKVILEVVNCRMWRQMP